MKLFKSNKSGSIIIWNEYFKKQYFYYSKREAIKLFKQEYKLRGKVTEVNYSPFLFS